VPINIAGVQFNEGYDRVPNWFISLDGNDLISRGNRYPHLRPFKRYGYGYSSSWEKCRGRTFSEGDVAPDAANNPAKLPVLKGCENGGGRVTFQASPSAASPSSIHVAFDREEAYATALGVWLPLEYNVNLSIRTATGSFPIPTPYLANLTKDGFDIKLSAPVPAGTDPGGIANKLEISYDIWSGGYNS
jgi:hypothetical protein